MIFTITTGSTDNAVNDKFSFLLCKNPTSVYNRAESNTNTVVGWYTTSRSSLLYNIAVTTDELAFIEKMRGINAHEYLSYQKDGVTPLKLNMVMKALRSAIVKSGYSDELSKQADEPFARLVCSIGPLPFYDVLISSFTAFGFDVSMSPAYQGEDCDHKVSGGVGMLMISQKDITLSKFLQQIFILILAFTQEYNLFGKLIPEQIMRYAHMSSAWLNECTDRNQLKRILRKLTNSNKEFMQHWISIAELEADEAQAVSTELYIGKKTLHKKLFEYTSNILMSLTTPLRTIIDYGSGNASFSKYLRTQLKNSDAHPEATIYAVDAKGRASARSGLKEYQMNLMYPNTKLLPTCEALDALVLMEVIEHFSPEKGRELLNTICGLLQPSMFVLTTPNYEYNALYGMEPGVYRHQGHVIEYTRESLTTEIIKHIESLGYSVTFEGITDLATSDLCATFVLVCYRNAQSVYSQKEIRKIEKFYEAVYLPISNYFIDKSELSTGYASRQFMTNTVEAIPFIQPTMAPVDYDFEHPQFLEHPLAAVDYYNSRGVTELTYEPKMMGSNAQVIIFKDIVTANTFGLDKVIYVNSRNGFPYFNEDAQDELDRLYAAMQPKMTHDFYVFNGEMLPWSYKGAGLVRAKFEQPLQTSYCYYRELLDKVAAFKATSSEDLTALGLQAPVRMNSIQEALTALRHYTKTEPSTYHIFDILAYGDIAYNSKGTKKIMKYVNGLFVDNIKKHEVIDQFASDVVKIVPTKVIPIESTELSCFVSEWVAACAKGLEGFVIKPLNKCLYTAEGYLIQPCLKVRGKDYLRIIYGENYLDPQIFEVIRRRNITRKRATAVQQWETSHVILRTWLNLNKIEHARYVAGFIGSESINLHSLDATL